MNADRLLAHYETIADAPDAIARLRRFVLDLAVRGKLVPQEATDEPASELLKQIAKEKARLVKAGELRKPRDLDSGKNLDEPFAIPATWRWVRLDTVGAIVGGGTPSAADPDNFTEPGKGVPWLTPADLGGYSDLYISRGSRDLSEKGSRASSATVMPKGAVLFTSRAPIGYVAIAASPISTNQGFKSIIPYIGDCSRFIAAAMKAFAPEIDAKAPGTTFKEVSGKIVAAIPFPLPPLAEQHRIVAKVDELIDLCDRLAVARASREATRDRLTAASLARLNAPDPETFHADARFALDALPALTTRPDQIKALRQTILNLAVRGKLVPQDATDGRGDDLLRQFAKLRNEVRFGGRGRREASDSEINDEEKYLEIPTSWAWARVHQVGMTQTGTSPSSSNPALFGDHIPFVKPADLDGNAINYDGPGLSEEGMHHSRVAPKNTVLMVCIGATLGKVNITECSVCFNQQINAVTPYMDGLHRFVAIALRASGFQELAWSKAGTGTLPIISKGKWEVLPIPLPPLAEQLRIVVKVDALMAICDRLEASLTASSATRRRLLDALLADALVPAEDRELEAAE
ncbi:MAG TPA: restriction endonuclease subunit S [Nitrobacter sp.]|nr:restriction endonuclease subunit S [Nitrobacter sp.]